MDDNINSDDIENIKWNDNIENVLINIMNTISVYKNVHAVTSINNIRYFNILTICGIVIGPISGILGAVDAIVNPDTEIIYPLMISIFGFISGVIATIIKFGKFDENASQHKKAFSDYNSLENNIELCLSMTKHDRYVNPSEYINDVQQKFEDIFMKAPIINKKDIIYMTKAMCDVKNLNLQNIKVNLQSEQISKNEENNDEDYENDNKDNKNDKDKKDKKDKKENSIEFPLGSNRRYSYDQTTNPVIIYELTRLKNNSQ